MVGVASTQTGTADINASQNVQKKALDLLEVYREPQMIFIHLAIDLLRI